MSKPDFYRAFEERYRGTRALIQGRLRVYLPYIQPLRQLYPPHPAATDLGCGRGEWLELLQSEGFAAQGVDLDEGMLAACRARGLPALHGDALGHLHSLADASQALVCGFHIVEHIAFEDLQTLVTEALRVLKPGGLLILETPNPENIVVGSNSFYLDPTHQRPLPPKLLSFLPEHYGYARTKVLRLQEESQLASRQHIQLIDVLAGVSPDYAVVAQKAVSPEQMQPFDAAFSTPHGIDLETLAQRFDERLPPHFMQDEFIARIENHIDAKLTPLLDQIKYAQESSVAAEARAQAAETERDALRQSLSWRITAPLRSAGQWALHPKKLAHAAAQTSQWLLAPLMRVVLKNPRLSYRINQGLMRYPFVYQHLLAIARRSGIVTDLSAQGRHGAWADPQGSGDLSTLTPEARAIYAQLKAEAGNNKEQP